MFTSNLLLIVYDVHGLKYFWELAFCDVTKWQWNDNNPSWLQNSVSWRFVEVFNLTVRCCCDGIRLISNLKKYKHNLSKMELQDEDNCVTLTLFSDGVVCCVQQCICKLYSALRIERLFCVYEFTKRPPSWQSSKGKIQRKKTNEKH